MVVDLQDQEDRVEVQEEVVPEAVVVDGMVMEVATVVLEVKNSP
jgi:hypothetical protein